MQYQPGMIVKSDAGHDQNRFYVIVQMKEGFAYIADGKCRKLEKPKRTTPMHLKRTGHSVELAGLDTNRKIRRALHELNYGPQASVAE